MAVRQIIPYSGTTSVPTAPEFIEGIIVLRNEVIPVVDLRQRLYPQLGATNEQPLILITHTSSGFIGFKVDEVRRIVNVTSDVLLPPPPLVRGVRGELLVAVVPVGDEIHLLIDVEQVLTVDEKRELREADLTPVAT
jgi:purine-binding chemotaxis protein CheW